MTKVVRLPRKRGPGSDLASIAQTLDGKPMPPQAPHRSERQLVYTKSPPPTKASPILSPVSPPPPPNPPSPPPPPFHRPPSPKPGCPFTAIKAYCFPFSEQDGTGCLLRVAQAEPGSSIVFHLTSSEGEHADVVVQLKPGTTDGYQRYVLPNSIKTQAVFVATVEYVGHPDWAWRAGVSDPTVLKTNWSPYDKVVDGVLCHRVKSQFWADSRRVFIWSFEPVEPQDR